MLLVSKGRKSVVVSLLGVVAGPRDFKKPVSKIFSNVSVKLVGYMLPKNEVDLVPSRVESILQNAFGISI